ncbi:ECF RNA polymerase sigma factor SigE [Phycisphaerales bacterium]|nr:ECF RNA polymerase sigma factor SigE [Phycisphaerales bacterium]
MTDPRTDEQLLSDFAKGHDAALGVLAARHERALVGLARGLLNGNTDSARDAVQDSWVRVIKSAKHFQHRAAVKTWLYRIVINKCMDLRRKQLPPSLNGHAAPHEPPGESPAPLATMQSQERTHQLREKLDAMNGETRLLLLLCYHEGLSHPEAADVLGIPVGTLKSRLHAALESLRTAMASEITP